VDYSKLPSALHPDNIDPKLLKSKGKTSQKKELMTQVHQTPDSIIFDPLDQPEDFINVEKINQVQALNIPAGSRLNSFTDYNILYGFKFNASNEKISKESAKKSKELQSELEELTSKSVMRLSKAAQEKTIEIIKLAYREASEKSNGHYELISRNLPMIVNRKLEQAGLMKMKSNGEPDLWSMEKIEIVRNNPTIETTYSVRKKKRELKAEIARLKNIKDSKGDFLNLIEQAFLKKIKHPTSPEDEQLSNHFVQLAVSNYTSYRPNFPYEYVVYPESSSELNTKIASALAAKYGATAVRGFQKLENPKIDTTSFINNNQDFAPEPKGTTQPDEKGIRGPQHQKYRDAMKMLQTNIAGSKGQIKNVRMNRPYVRNWQMSPDLGQQVNPQHELSGLRNRRILLIDDNAGTSGTMQAINHILMREQRPKAIHIYTPLYVNFHY